MALNGYHFGIVVIVIVISVVVADPLTSPILIKVLVLYEYSSLQFTNHLNIHPLIVDSNSPERRTEMELLL